MSVLRGVYIVMTTPFNEDGNIDYAGMEANIEWYIANKAQGLLVAGALGEYSSMDFSERKTLAEFTLCKVKGRLPVVVGTTTSRTETTVALSCHAHQHGAAGVMILPPPGAGLLDEEIFGFYTTVASSVPLPVMVYNNPGSSGMDMTFDLLQRIAVLPHIDCIKEASGDIKRISRLVAELDGAMTPFCGWEDMHYESFCAGAQGWVCMGANFAPGLTRDIFTLAADNGDYSAALRLSQTYTPLARHLETAGKVTQTCKYIMEQRGLVGGNCRLPRLPLTDEERAAIDRLLKNIELY